MHLGLAALVDELAPHDAAGVGEPLRVRVRLRHFLSYQHHWLCSALAEDHDLDQLPDLIFTLIFSSFIGDLECRELVVSQFHTSFY